MNYSVARTLSEKQAARTRQTAHIFIGIQIWAWSIVMVSFNVREIRIPGCASLANHLYPTVALAGNSATRH
ncbi:hypothetical protein L207DRAFT_517716 [Hyaloscypha variabilis F]|uniref:Uncharacterized protein n=1 Tax=Hyaloscypha variabilis (strain UAMH 11265 / GT02V1 / F) TaxID=1149755 RepID=A0A2J6R5A8_HYAVF|nr:hypothetical protein L207DRAFT_517716 [Hyaloscypha variabilis F]